MLDTVITNPSHNSRKELKHLDFDFLHEISSRMAAGAASLHEVLSRVVEFAIALVKCDSCFVYVLENNELVLRASKNPHEEVIDRLKLPMGQGITGYVAENKQPIAISQDAVHHPHFRMFSELPEDCYEAFLSVPLLSRGRVVGVINLQHRKPHVHTQREIQMISTIGFLVGAEIETARLEFENSNLSRQLEARKILERAKGILQREHGLTEEQAYLTLQRQSRQRRLSMKEVAEAIILSSDIKREFGPGSDGK